MDTNLAKLSKGNGFSRFSKLRKATISFVMSVHPSFRLSAWNNSVPTGQIFMKAFCCRPVHLLLHTGPLVNAPQCYVNTIQEPLPMVQLTPCDYWVTGVHEGVYWCEDSEGVHSNNHWRKKRSPVPERLVGTVADLLNLTLLALTNGFERLDEDFSNIPEPIFGEVQTDGSIVTHCGALNLTGTTMFLREINTTCPAQTEKDENGLERYWPAINVGKYDRTHLQSLLSLLFDGLNSYGRFHAFRYCINET